MTAPDKQLDIDVVSDVMCPWCYIGKRRLEKALDRNSDVPIDVRWRPFLLDATIPPEGMDRKAYLDRKFGSDRAKEIYAQIKQAGEDEGIAFAFDKIERSPSTVDAHRLIRWAATAGVQDGVVEGLFDAYFVNGGDIGDKAVLVEVAEAAGMERAIVERLLAGDADLDLVRREIGLAQQMGVSGVPCFIFANKYVVMGAQDPDVLVSAIERAWAEITADEETAVGS
jgi:predicted DsbA family dithiol-disulfide isomerase